MHYVWNWNEWNVVILSAVVMSVFLTIRKHFRPIVIAMVWLFSATYLSTLDYALAATPFHLYDCGDNATYEPITAIAYLFMYSPFSFAVLYTYDKWEVRGKKLALFLAGWTCFSVFFEWLNIQIGFFHYTYWRLYYSVPFYPVSVLILIQVYRYILKHLPKKRAIS